MTIAEAREFCEDAWIYIKPMRTIKYITLNFVAVKTDVTFEEVVGKIT
jgi:hypothetical protein